MPSLMCLVRWAAAAMNTSGEAMVSQPPLWWLADPGFVVAELVEPFQELHVALKG